jgi:hypothetical protein
MKTQIIIQAKRNRKPFITEGKKYEVIKEVNAGYRIKNDLGKESTEYKSDFWTDRERRYGFEVAFSGVKAFIIPTIAIIKSEGSWVFIIALFCFGFSIEYTPKLKL